jgi:hypothetical protein
MKILIIISLILTLITGCCDNLSQQSVILRDTLYLTRYDTILVQGKAEILYRKDTIIHTYPFIAKKDTVIRYLVNNRVKYDTLKFRYEFPNNDFLVNLKRQVDTLKVINTEIKTTFEKTPTIWDKLKEYIIYLFFVLIGVGLGSLLRK